MDINLFQTTPFLYPLRARGFTTFSGGIEMLRWLQMGEFRVFIVDEHNFPY